MLTAALWGLVQGLTEFLPISSSGHLVLVPALLGIDEPDLATSAVLHLGTLAAVVWYYRRDLARLVRVRSDPGARRILWLLVLGTIPAAGVGLLFDTKIEIIFSEPWLAAALLIGTGAVLLMGLAIPRGDRVMEDGRTGDALVVGMAQAVALLPGVSRSGMTMTAAAAQGFERVEAARFAFLLAVPAIAGAGILKFADLLDSGGFRSEMLVGVATAAVSGYLAISLLIRLLGRYGLAPYAVYCIVFGALAWWLV
jgi:undecaprenyl-diphosphatase